MSRIRGTNTQPERLVRSILHRLGFRFRLKPQKLPGSPDVVLARYQTAVFVHGCFWHRHHGCRFAYTPKSRKSFWELKFLKNITRDRRVKRRLRKLGWHVVIVWECELRHPKRLSAKIAGLKSSIKYS
jgi:DNA mismatch endonuclease, patch repair protein